MNEILSVAFRVIDQSGYPYLYCKEMMSGRWEDAGRRFDNLQQLIGTMSTILERPKVDFDELGSGKILENQVVTRQKLHDLRLPGFVNRERVSDQNTIPPDDYPS
jgi:hypothetical protein